MPRTGSGAAVTAASTTSWMFDQRAFHFERTDAVAAAFDDVVVAAYEEIVAVAVAPCHIVQVVVFAADRFSGAFRILEIADEKSGRVGLFTW
ncbi:MAG: hypothetical protein ACLT98_15000 [Eggerthellaceae bacterium]